MHDCKYNGGLWGCFLCCCFSSLFLLHFLFALFFFIFHHLPISTAPLGGHPIFTDSFHIGARLPHVSLCPHRVSAPVPRVAPIRLINKAPRHRENAIAPRIPVGLCFSVFRHFASREAKGGYCVVVSRQHYTQRGDSNNESSRDRAENVFIKRDSVSLDYLPNFGRVESC